MQRSIWTSLGGLAVLLAMAVMARAADEPAKTHAGPGKASVDSAAPKLGDYWIGLACVPASDTLRAHLGLHDDQGLVVESVVPDSPAAKAGIEVNDVLVAAGNQKTGTIQELVDAISRAKKSKLTIQLYRAGKLEKVDVTPAKRPEDMGVSEPGSRAKDFRDAWRKYFDEFRPGERGGPPMRFRFFHPGAVLPPGDRAFSVALPDDMTVTVTKHGDGPAKIRVQKGDKKWEVTADKLGELPDGVRQPVEKLLGRPDVAADDKGEGRFDFDFFPDWAWRGGPPEGETPPKLHPQEPREPRVDEMRDRMEKMEKMQKEFREQFDQMRKRLEELRENRPRAREPENQNGQQRGV